MINSGHFNVSFIILITTFLLFDLFLHKLITPHDPLPSVLINKYFSIFSIYFSIYIYFK